MTVIKTGNGKQLIVGSVLFSDGKVIVDAHDVNSHHSVHTNVPISELADALNKIDGVEVKYTKPFDAAELPLGSIVRVSGQSKDNGYVKVAAGWRHIKLTAAPASDTSMTFYGKYNVEVVS